SRNRAWPRVAPSEPYGRGYGHTGSARDDQQGRLSAEARGLNAAQHTQTGTGRQPTTQTRRPRYRQRNRQDRGSRPPRTEGALGRLPQDRLRRWSEAIASSSAEARVRVAESQAQRRGAAIGAERR